MFERRRNVLAVMLCILTAVVLSTAKAPAAEPEFGRLDMIADGMDVLSNVATRRDKPDRLFLLEKDTGNVRIIDNGRLLNNPFLDIGDRLVEAPHHEEGLLGLAFSPDVADEPRVYLTYIDRDHKLVLSGFRVDEDADQAVASSEHVFFKLDQSMPFHGCGHIVFGPKDSALYICIGDDMSNDNVSTVIQDLGNWRGKLLRIPLDMLTANNGDAPDTLEGLDPQIVAYGLRNPWRFTFDPRTGDLFIPDVGRHEIEELNFLKHGAERANFGWPFAQGNRCAGRQMVGPARPFMVVATGTCEDMELVWPIMEYEHEAGNCAVIGGEVYRGERHPEWDGAFVFADMCSGKIWALRRPGSEPSLRLIVESDVMPYAVGKDAAGEIVIVHGGGAVYRLSFPEDAERGWRSVDEILFERMLRQRREGTGLIKRKLDGMLHSESWQLGSRLVGWYQTVSGWFQ